MLFAISHNMCDSKYRQISDEVESSAKNLSTKAKKPMY